MKDVRRVAFRFGSFRWPQRVPPTSNCLVGFSRNGEGSQGFSYDKRISAFHRPFQLFALRSKRRLSRDFGVVKIFTPANVGVRVDVLLFGGGMLQSGPFHVLEESDSMNKPSRQKKFQGELTEADLAKVVGGNVIVGLQNKRRRRNVTTTTEE